MKENNAHRSADRNEIGTDQRIVNFSAICLPSAGIR